MIKVNGTYWKDPSFLSDPDNWVFSPMVRHDASQPCFSAATLVWRGKRADSFGTCVAHLCNAFISFQCCIHPRSIQHVESAHLQNTILGD